MKIRHIEKIDIDVELNLKKLDRDALENLIDEVLEEAARRYNPKNYLHFITRAIGIESLFYIYQDELLNRTKDESIRKAINNIDWFRFKKNHKEQLIRLLQTLPNDDDENLH